MTFFALTLVLTQTGFSSPPMVAAGEEPVRPPLVTAPRVSAPREDVVVSTAAPVGEERRRLYEVAVPGAIAALGGWLGGWATFFSSIDCNNSGWLSYSCNSASMLLMIPQLGPWLVMTVGGTSDPWFAHNLALGLTQAAGLVAMITGFALSVPTGDGAVSVNVAPTGNGVALGGTF